MRRDQYLILGSTGSVGRRVFATMQGLGHAVKGASRRDGAPGKVRFDLLDPTTYAEALHGVGTVLLMARPGDEDAHIYAEPFVEAMVRRRVQRVVVLSALGAGKLPEFSLHKVEILVEKSGMRWTHVRPNFFMQMLALPPLCTEIATTSTLSLPLGDAKVAYVDVEDVAAVLVRALIDPSLSRSSLDVNGPRSLDHHEIAALISQQMGRRIRYLPLTEESARQLLTIRGLSPSHVERVMRFYALARAGWCAPNEDESVSTLLGRPLGTFESFVKAYSTAW